MIEISRYDDKTYVAEMDIETFESYGLDIHNLVEGAEHVDVLIEKIIGMIISKYGNFNADSCGVGIVVDEFEGKVSVSVGEEASKEFLEEITGVSNLTDVSDEFEIVKSVEAKPEKRDRESASDYRYGIIVEINDIEEVIGMSNVLDLDRSDNVSLFEDDDKKYYVLIDKTDKYNMLVSELVKDIDEPDVVESIEFEVGLSVFEEYRMLRSYFEEKGLNSKIKKGYLIDYCKILMKDNAFVELRKHFN